MSGESQNMLPFELGFWNETMKQRAEEELGENNDTRAHKIKELRAILEADKDVFCRTDDEFLLPFLRVKKFRVKETRNVIRKFFQTRKDYPEVYSEEIFPRLMRNYTDHIIDILPFRDETGSVVFIFRIENWDVAEQTFAELLHSITFNSVICALTDVATQLCGVKYIIDLRQLSLTHIKSLSLRHLILMTKGLRNHLPVRFAAIHICSESSIVQYFWTVTRTVLSEKMRNRFHFHSSDLSTLHKHFDSSMLPEDIGGTLKYDNKFIFKRQDIFEKAYTETSKSGYVK